MTKNSVSWNDFEALGFRVDVKQKPDESFEIQAQSTFLHYVKKGKWYPVLGIKHGSILIPFGDTPVGFGSNLFAFDGVEIEEEVEVEKRTRKKKEVAGQVVEQSELFKILGFDPSVDKLIEGVKTIYKGVSTIQGSPKALHILRQHRDLQLSKEDPISKLFFAHWIMEHPDFAGVDVSDVFEQELIEKLEILKSGSVEKIRSQEDVLLVATFLLEDEMNLTQYKEVDWISMEKTHEFWKLLNGISE